MLTAGARLGPYEILSSLGAGGMGEVYRARDPKLRREVAVKILPAAFAADPDRVARFEREAYAVAALSHPNILAIHDFGTDAGVTYAVMELLEGQSLRDAINAGALPRRKAVDYAAQIASGLGAAHARGVVHRDLKPENVFVSAGGHVTILDFGLAANRADGAHADTTAGATHAGAVLGTPGYMSPEQVRGEPADYRSDIFSFGCVLYEMLSGTRAFQGASSIDTLHATLRSEPRDLFTLPDIPLSLTRIVSRCLEKAPVERFQSASDLVFALAALVDSSATARSGAGRSVAVAVAIIAGVGVAAWSLFRESPPSTPAPASTSAASSPRGIAVLPFENLGGADQEYFATGVTEEVTLQIAKISALRVMSRAAVARFKDPAAELPAMTRELDIGAVLTGSVRHAGDQVRVGVQLLAAPSGETLWSEQYDGDLKNIFDVQTNVAVRVARALQASLAPDERARIERAPTENAQAYELFLKARTMRNAVAKENQEGIELLRRAVALDPRFALAHAAMAVRYHFLGRRTGRADATRGIEAARTALDIDSQLSRGHHALAVNLAELGHLEEARLAMHRAVELDSSFQHAMNDFSIMETNAGRPDLALYWSKRAFPLAPNLAVSFFHVSIPLVWLDDVAAERWVQAAARRFPTTSMDGVRLQMVLAVIELRRGRTEAAIERMRATVAAQPQSIEGQMTLTEIAMLGGGADAAARLDTILTEGDGAGARGFFTPHTPRTMRAFLFMKSGDGDRARPLLDSAVEANRQAMEAGDKSFGPLYENAALYLMKGDRGAALESLDRAERAGWKDAQFLPRDPLLAPLASDPRFLEIVARIERDVRAMRARVDLSDLDRWISDSTAFAASGTR